MEPMPASRAAMAEMASSQAKALRQVRRTSHAPPDSVALYHDLYSELDAKKITPLRIILLRCLMFAMLVVLTSVLGYYIFRTVDNSQIDLFEEAFTAASTRLSRSIEVSNVGIAKEVASEIKIF